MALTKQQRNDLFKAVAQSGLNATEFDLSVNDVERFVSYASLVARRKDFLGSWLVRIEHVPSRSRFMLYQVVKTSVVMDRFYAQYRLGVDPIHHQPIREWSKIPVPLTNWASSIKDYVDTPDLWEEMDTQRELLAETSLESLENTQFTSAEYVAISAQMREIKDYIKENLSLTSEQLAKVETRIDEAEAASRRLGRKDWLLLFLGTTVQLYVTDMVPATAVQHITTIALQGLGHMFGIGISPPPLAG